MISKKIEFLMGYYYYVIMSTKMEGYNDKNVEPKYLTCELVSGRVSFTKEINDLIMKGYEPVGGVNCVYDIFVIKNQLMCKRNPKYKKEL